MAKAGVRWSGFDEYLKELVNLPQVLVGEAGHLTEGTVNGLVVDVRSAYSSHVHTGNLRNRVVIAPARPRGARLFTGMVVKSTARHATIFEKGTDPRRTKRGFNRGTMPAADLFVPLAMRARRRLVDQFRQLLLRHGASSVTVTK